MYDQSVVLGDGYGWWWPCAIDPNDRTRLESARIGVLNPSNIPVQLLDCSTDADDRRQGQEESKEHGGRGEGVKGEEKRGTGRGSLFNLFASRLPRLDHYLISENSIVSVHSMGNFHGSANEAESAWDRVPCLFVGRITGSQRLAYQLGISEQTRH